MCFFSALSASAQSIENRFKAKFENVSQYQPGNYVAFEFPQTPVITNKDTNLIRMLRWGLIPPWAKDPDIRKYTLNARMETIGQKPTFRSVANNRCLVIADAFFEWQWMDPKGKEKQKYKLTLPDNEPFAFAGLWSEWANPLTGEIWQTYTIITTQANELMSHIHNSKKRMPVILQQGEENMWLHQNKIVMQNDKLIAEKMP